MVARWGTSKCRSPVDRRVDRVFARDARVLAIATELPSFVRAHGLARRLRADAVREREHRGQVLHHRFAGCVTQVERHRGSKMLIRETAQRFSRRRDLVFARHVERAVEDLNPHLGRGDRFDRLSHHAGNGGFPLHLILVPRGSVCSSYHSTIILP